MSHFTVLVIGENPEEQLAPFSENLKVEEYEEDCSCATDSMHEKKYEILFNEFGGDFNEKFREPYHKMPSAEAPNWEEYIKPYVDRENQLEKELIEYKKPDPNCEDCEGTGKVMSTYNTNSKWDWHQLGGRWTGFFLPKAGKTGVCGTPGIMTEPSSGMLVDSIRKGDIDFEGTVEMMKMERERIYAKAMKEIEKNEGRIEHLEFICGIKTKKMEAVTAVVDGKDIMAPTLVPETMEEYTSRVKMPATFAVLKDGKWYERGNMGWWGIVSDEKDEDSWEEEWKKLMDSLPDDTLVSVYDCHI
jgi:hypothetical protein